MSVLDKIKAMRQETKAVETKLIKTKSYSDEVGIQNLEEGKTTVRIVKHPQDPIPFFPFRSTWLKVDEKLDNLSRYMLNKTITEEKLEKALGIKKVEDLKEKSNDEVRAMVADELGRDYSKTVNKRIFISRVHGNSEIPDIIEEYVKFAQSHIKGISQDQEETSKMIAPIRGYRDKAGKWNPGILPNTSYMFYSVLPETDANIKRFEMWEKHMNDLEKLYASFDDEAEPLTIDPFSDHKEGVPLIFDKSKNDKGKWEYTITDKKNTSRTGTFVDFVKQFALTAEQTEELEKLSPLSELYTNVYSVRDFELALNGLQKFDQEHKINIFENDDFLDIVTDIAKNYDQGSDEGENKKEEPKPSTSKAKETPKKEEKQEEPEEEASSIYGNSIDELKAFIKEHKLGIRVTTRMTFEDVVESIEEVLEDQKKEAEGEQGEDHPDGDDEKTYAEEDTSNEGKDNSFTEDAERSEPSVDIDSLRTRLRSKRNN